MKSLLFSLSLGLAVSLVAWGAPSWAQNSIPPAKPNFTGTWKLNVAKSDFGPSPKLKSRVDKLEHREASLRMTSTRVTEDGDEDTINLNLTIGDQESTNTLHGAEMKTKVKWEGAVLLLDSTVKAEGGAVNLKDKWTLSADGKTLMITRHYTGPEGEADLAYVLERQE